MNKQYKSASSRGIEWTDHTWNPVGGCKHGCRWTMPDGSTAICYAEEVAVNLRTDKFYPNGFEHHYWHPERLGEPAKLKTPAKIFLDSMSDLMGSWVPDDQIHKVLDACTAAPQHSFQLLTKNAPRLKDFAFPDNVWVGVSAPPSQMFGQPLSPKQQGAMVARQLSILSDVQAKIRWMSIEPLAFDIGADFHLWVDLNDKPLPLEWVVIGAASNGKKLYQPKSEWVSDLLMRFDKQKIPVFFKGNLDWPKSEWREEFPLAV